MTSHKSQDHHPNFFVRLQRYFLTGILTIIPIGVTWFIVDLLLHFLSSTGRPFVVRLSNYLRPLWPSAADWIQQSWFLSVFSVLLVIFMMTLLGWIANRVIGKRILEFIDNVMDKIPMVRNVYNAMKQLIMTMQTKPDKVHRVVMIEFPHREMKTVGLVTRTLRDKDTGKELAAVYVPTTPNPTSGYLEIVPVERVVSTDWTIDEAMTFIVSGGAVGPDQMSFEISAKNEVDLSDVPGPGSEPEER